MWTDAESSEDYLNFGEVADIAVDIAESPAMLPVSIGIFGNWGSGKSSILKLIEKKLEDNKEKYLIVNFDAWLYQGFDDARMSLMETIGTAISQEARGNEQLLTKIGGFFSRINYFRLLGLIGEGVALANGIPTGGIIAKVTGMLSGISDGVQTTEEYQGISATIKETKETATGLLKPVDAKSPPQQIDAFREEYGDIVKGIKKTLIVFIDNLDRCSPSNAIQTLEAIRLFLFLNNTAFIIAADEDMIRSAVREYVKGSDAKHQIDYLDKLIQIPIRVPKVGVREVRSYLFMLYAIEQHNIDLTKIEKLRTTLEDNLRSSWKDNPITRSKLLELFDETEKDKLAKLFEIADRVAPLLANSPLVQGNPRIIKRLLNVVRMRLQTAKRRKMDLLDDALMTKLVIFERCTGQEVTAEFYRMVDIEHGKPKCFQIDEEGKPKGKFPALMII